MDIELLKELYYKERKALEEMWVYNQEGKLQLLKLRKEIAERARSDLNITEILGRNDISDEIKEELLRPNEDKTQEYLHKKIDADLNQIEEEEQGELKNARYSTAEYADYLYQLEKVLAIESALGENHLFPEMVYEEMKEKELLEDKKKEVAG
jgi:hypothetical protein